MKIVQYNVWKDNPRPVKFCKKIGKRGNTIKNRMNKAFSDILKEYNENTNKKLNYYIIKEMTELFGQTVGWCSVGFINQYKHVETDDKIMEKYKFYSSELCTFSEKKNPDIYYITTIIISSIMLNTLVDIHMCNGYIEIKYCINYLLDNHIDEFITYFMMICHTLFMMKNFLINFTKDEKINGNNTLKCIEYNDYFEWMKDNINKNCIDFPEKQVKIYEVLDEYIFGSTNWINELELKHLFKMDINFDKTDIEILHFVFGIMQFGGIFFKNPLDNAENIIKERMKELL